MGKKKKVVMRVGNELRSQAYEVVLESNVRNSTGSLSFKKLGY